MTSPPKPDEGRTGAEVLRVTAGDYDSVRPTGTVVLLLSDKHTREAAAERAIELSASWAASGLRIVLADLHLDRPLLEPQSSEDAMEGIVDVFLYGASLSRIARPAREGGFFLIPAGTYAPDPGEVYRHPRWKKVVAGFRDTGATLLLFVPGESPELSELAAWAGEAILLDATNAEPTASLLRAMGIDVLAAVDPPVGSARRGEERGTETEVPEVLIANALVPEAAGAETVSRPARPRDLRPDDLDLPPPPPRLPPRRRRTVLIAAILTAVAVLTVLYLIVSLRPGLLSAGDPSAERAESTRGVVTASGEGQLLHYSVHVKAFTSLSAATTQLAVERRRLGAVPFFISPEEIQGVLYYRIMAGLLSDTTGAILLRQRLVDAGAVEEDQAISTYGLPFVPHAFDLGEYPTREAAMSRADSLLALGIPSYLAVMPYSDGSRRWRVYGGAFRDSAGAERMAELLSAAGVQSQWTVRTGEPAPDIE